MRFAVLFVAAVCALSCTAAYNKDEVSFVCDATKKYEITCPNCNDFCKGCGITCDKDNRAVSIDWSYSKVSSVSSGISKFTQLKDFILHDTSLSSFPTNVLNLENLRVLDLHNSKSSKLSIPNNAGKAKNLITLDMSNCGMNAIPSVIAQMPSLKILKLSRNTISVVPEGLNATKLEYLSLAANHFKDFPEAVCRIPTLKSLILNTNHLNSFPQSCNLPSLTFLRLSDNRYTVLPQPLETLTALVSLDVSKNYIDTTNVTSTTWPALDALNLFHNNFDCHKIDNAFRTTRDVTCLPASQAKRKVPNDDWGTSTSATVAIVCVLIFAAVVAIVVIIAVIVMKNKHSGYTSIDLK